MIENWLYVVRGKNQGRRFEIATNQKLSIGRDKSNTIRLIDEEASRLHAEISSDADGLRILDLSSSNGTFVNGEKVDSHLLKRGDQIDIGQTSFLVGQSTETSLLDSHEIPSSIPIVDDSDSSVQLDSDFNSNQLVSAIKSDLQFMYHAALATSNASEVDQMLEEILNIVFDWLHVERGCVLLWNSDKKKFEPRATRYRTMEAKSIKLKVSRSLIKYILDRKEGILTTNVEIDERLSSKSSFTNSGVKEIICVPIRGRAFIHGFIYADKMVVENGGGNRLNHDHLKLMVAIGFQVAAFIENNEYYSSLVKSERLTAVGQTLATLSHHVKNILQSINGGTHLIEDGLTRDDLDVIRKGWGIVKRNQRNMSNLVMDMVSFSKPSTPHRKKCNLNQTISNAVRNARENSGKEHVKIEAPETPVFNEQFYDEALMTRAIENVVSHVLDGCPNGFEGNVQITSSVRNFEGIGDCVSIDLRDNFQELSENRVSKLFEPFAFEGENDVHGIGLAVTRKILEEHNGKIKVRKRTAKGLQFLIYFPIVPAISDHPTGTFRVEDYRPLPKTDN